MQQDLSEPLNFVALATQTEGYSANDLKDLVGRAIHQCVIRTSKDGLKVFISAFSNITRSSTSFILQPVILAEDFSLAQIGFTPLSLRDVKLQKSETQWSDIGGTFRSHNHFSKVLNMITGLHETRKILRETLEWPTKYGVIFAKCPLRLRSG